MFWKKKGILDCKIRKKCNFTENARSLIIGTNIGGLGTIIASLASLISYKIYCKTDHPRYIQYLTVFTAVNVGILIPLYLFNLLF